MNSQIIEFRLQAVTPGNYRFAVGTAGSATLVLQTMEAVQAARTWLEAEVPVDEYLADQLLLPLALADGGSFRTTKPSLHATTNAHSPTISAGFNPI